MFRALICENGGEGLLNAARMTLIDIDCHMHIDYHQDYKQCMGEMQKLMPRTYDLVIVNVDNPGKEQIVSISRAHSKKTVIIVTTPDTEKSISRVEKKDGKWVTTRAGINTSKVDAIDKRLFTMDKPYRTVPILEILGGFYCLQCWRELNAGHDANCKSMRFAA